MTARNYSNKATPATLGGGISSSDTSLSLSTVAGLPASFPFTLVIEPDSTNAEVVTCTGLVGTIATVTRGQDGSTGVAHSAGATVYHDISARDLQEPQDHIAATVAHGATGAVVGTANSQTLTNKTVDLGSNTVTMTKAQLNTAVSDADVATLTGAETLTGKTVALGSNTVSGTRAQFNTAMTDADFATLGGTETLTNKTVSGPTITATSHVQSPETTGGSSRTQRPWANLVRSAGSQSIATNSATQITFTGGATSSGDSSFTDVPNNRLVAPIDGLYLVTACATLDVAFSETFAVDILVGGTVLARTKGYGAGLGASSVTVSSFENLLAGSLVTAQVTQRSGSSANLVAAAATPPGTFLRAVYLGPAVT